MIPSRSLALAAVAAAALLSPATAFATSILLTNDDGYDAPGIVAMQAALEKAGYDVTIVAPAGNRSGSSAAITTSTFAVTKVSDKVYAVDATPATTVLYGVSVVFKDAAPDLIVSGTNAGANVGPTTVLSGTVGNAITAVTQFAPTIPAVAFSANLFDSDPTTARNVRQFKTVARFAAKLVDRLVKRRTALAKYAPYALNVNWPAVAESRIAGVRYAVQGRAPSFSWGFAEVSDGVWAISPSAPPAATDVPRSDTRLLGRNYVTISVLDGDYTAPWRDWAGVSALIGAPTP